MVLSPKSKLESCPVCESAKLNNRVLVKPGEDPQIFVECASCEAFVARYLLKSYTCEDPYRSFLRQMRQQRMSSGALTRERQREFEDRLAEDLALARELSSSPEEKDLEDLFEESS
ncbi:MAG: hypothetical protein QF492_05590 [Candidatus Krumholzibacteria bacterium]|jgi:transcription elongation factor Elf1|nr:hypothetical protein [Candidatus Krumholzibacteria bacterium]MDP6669358.1 hypothetical protein [Candidatus Krumholzibacteria bacterium]MDP6796729.1 hypothetical protein [Candidatus Krumholzibacteria bacterium]MDP7022370.1 hypothetical protein [Candidatus Krumholzibacteria bacterium]